jgi:hypothetical protein
MVAGTSNRTRVKVIKKFPLKRRYKPCEEHSLPTNKDFANGYCQ